MLIGFHENMIHTYFGTVYSERGRSWEVQDLWYWVISILQVLGKIFLQKPLRNTKLPIFFIHIKTRNMLPVLRYITFIPCIIFSLVLKQQNLVYPSWSLYWIASFRWKQIEIWIFDVFHILISIAFFYVCFAYARRTEGHFLLFLKLLKNLI